MFGIRSLRNVPNFSRLSQVKLLRTLAICQWQRACICKAHSGLLFYKEVYDKCTVLTILQSKLDP